MRFAGTDWGAAGLIGMPYLFTRPQLILLVDRYGIPSQRLATFYGLPLRLIFK
jgi:hypothetical protein